MAAIENKIKNTGSSIVFSVNKVTQSTIDLLAEEVLFLPLHSLTYLIKYNFILFLIPSDIYHEVLGSIILIHIFSLNKIKRFHEW